MRKNNEQGQVVLEWDETGLYETIYQYIPGTKLVDRVTNPDNSNIEYAFDNEDRVIETSSTVDGQENASFTGFTAGEITDMNFTGNSNYLNYVYDKKRRVSSIKLGTDSYETITYEDKVSETDTIVDKVVLLNARNETFRAVVDKAGNFEKAYYKANPGAAEILTLEKTYDAYGQMIHLVDHLSGEEISIEYNDVGDVTSYVSTCDNRTHTETFTYSTRGQLSEIIYSGAISRTTTFSYKSNASGDLQELRTGNFVYNVTYDQYDRQESETIKDAAGNVIDSRSISYRKEGNHATHMVNELVYADNSRITYEYDTRGNIQTIKENGLLMVRYKYDGLNRLIREDNQMFGETYLYTYDRNGNILSKEVQSFTTSDNLVSGTGAVTSYTYDNKNHFQANNIQEYYYDPLGNPLIYHGQTLSWTRARKLIAFGEVQFAYDAQGKRISKNTKKYYYNSAEKLIASSDGMEYFYGNAGVIGFVYNGQQYAYRKNLQGDIIAILDNTGSVIVQYVYDAWGVGLALDANGNEITSLTHIGQLNPFRYRGYFYDVETGLYYLKSRYYDPTTGRFINMDSITYADSSVINGLNLYVYCENNPVMDIDPDGNWSWKRVFKAVAAVVVVAAAVVVSVASAGTAVGVMAAGAVVGATINGAISGVTAYQEAKAEGKTGKDLWLSVVDKTSTGMLTGAASGALAASSAGFTEQILGNMLISGLEYCTTNFIDGEAFNIMDFGVSLIAGAGGGAFGGKGLLAPSAKTQLLRLSMNQAITNTGRQWTKNLTYSITKGTIGATVLSKTKVIWKKVVELFN